MDDEFLKKMHVIKQEFEGNPDRMFVAQAALSTQKWVQDLREEGVSEPFEEWTLDFIMNRLKKKT